MSALHHHHAHHLRGREGDAEIYIQPSTFQASGTTANTWYRGIPAAGVPSSVPPIPAIVAQPANAIPTCADLLCASPPTLLERYEIYGLAIGFAAQAATGTAQIELALLVNDHVRQVLSQTISTTSLIQSTGMFTADLINALRLGARDRLSLRAGILSSAGGAAETVWIGVQMTPAGAIEACESVIRYRVVPEHPGRRVG